MAKAKLAKVLSGIAGQYFVAAELSRLGYIATITLRNTQGIDVLAANVSGTRSVGIQVKTNQGSAKQWLLNRKAELLCGENLFYVFVNLNKGGAPAYHVVESHIVAEIITTGHAAWLKGAKRDGTARRDSNMRVFRDRACAYLDGWARLGLDGAQGSAEPPYGLSDLNKNNDSARCDD